MYVTFTIVFNTYICTERAIKIVYVKGKKFVKMQMLQNPGGSLD